MQSIADKVWRSQTGGRLVFLEEENIERFRRTINELCELTEQDLIPKVSIDMQLPLAYVTEELVDELKLSAFWKRKYETIVC